MAVRLHIRGANPSVPRAEVLRATNWFAHHYLDQEYIERAWITIKHQDRIRQFACGESTSFWGDPFRYNIKIGNHPRPLYLRTLFHELWHVKQYLSGELSVLENGVQWKQWKFQGNNILDRLTTPWERSTYRMEGRLYDRYRRHLKRAGLTFYRKSNLIKE